MANLIKLVLILLIAQSREGGSQHPARKADSSGAETPSTSDDHRSRFLEAYQQMQHGKSYSDLPLEGSRGGDTGKQITESNQIQESLAIYNFPEEDKLKEIKVAIYNFITEVEANIKAVEEDKAIYLENLENEKIVKIVHFFSTPPCLGKNQFDDLKRSFRLRMTILEVPLKEGINELRDKVNDLRRIMDLEKSIQDVKLVTCKLSIVSCVEEDEVPLPCLSDSCMTSNNIMEPESYPRPQENFPRKTFPMDCGEGKFRCANGDCIRQNYVCDGQPDCPDQSDEVAGCPATCDGRRCRNLQCLKLEDICNGADNCGDGSDEEGCTTMENCNLSKEEFPCYDLLQCLPLTALCDGKPDCNDLSDEGDSCAATEGCDRCAALGGACLKTPSGPLCISDCPTGYIFDFYTGTCILTNTTDAFKVVYKSNSFFSTIRKIKILDNRLNNGYSILKKRLNFELMQAVIDLNKCMIGIEPGFRAPFEISAR